MGVYPYYGLNIPQWGISIGIGLIGLIVGMLAKMIPEKQLCLSFGNKEKDPLETHETGINLKRKKSSFHRNMSLNHAVH